MVAEHYEGGVAAAALIAESAPPSSKRARLAAGARAGSGDVTRRGAAALEELVTALVAEKFLMVVTKVVHRGWTHVLPAQDKVRRLRAMAACVEYLGQAGAARFAPKVVGTLSAALAEGADLEQRRFKHADTTEGGGCELVAVAVDALSRYARLLPDDALAEHLSAIATALLPALEEQPAAVNNGWECDLNKSDALSSSASPGVMEADAAVPAVSSSSSPTSQRAALRRACQQRAAELLRWLLVEKGEALASAFCTVPRLPEEAACGLRGERRPELAEARAAWVF